MKRCVVLRILSRICCVLFCGLCLFQGKRACAQKVATYLMNVAASAETSSNTAYSISISTSSKALTVSFPLGGPHAFNVRAEYFRTASLPKVTEKVWDVKADWKFRSIPVTVSYSYSLPSPSARIIPVAGVGLSAHFFKETRKVSESGALFIESPYDAVLVEDPDFVDIFGLKFGAEMSMGLRTQLTQHIFLMTEARYRYVNCSTDTPIKNLPSGAVTILDFSLDIGFVF